MRRKLTWAVLLCLAVALVAVLPSAATAAEPGTNPSFTVRPTDDVIHGYSWAPYSDVLIEIDDPTNGPGVDYSATAETNEDGSLATDYDGPTINFDIEPGDLVTLSQGTWIKTHVVIDLRVTLADPKSDTVFGVGAPSSTTWVGLDDTYSITVMSDATGAWTADFSSVHDIQWGMQVGVEQQDEDGDNTWIFYDLPMPLAPAFEVHRGLWGSGVYFKYWLAGETLALTIDDPATAASPDFETSVVAEEYPEGGDGFGIGVDYDVVPGDVVTVADGSTTKSHVVTDIAVTSVEMAADVVRGTAALGTEVLVYGDVAGEFSTFAADDGTWAVDTSAELDIVPGMIGGAEQVDTDGDSTVYDWAAPATLTELLDQMVADGRLPNKGLANSILKQAQNATPKALTNHLASLVAHEVITQQTMDEILAMVTD